MACDWHSAPLGELISYIGKGVAPKYINDGPDATMVLGQKCVRNQALQYEQARFHNSAEKAVNPDKEVRKGDILVNATGVGSAGRVAQVMADPSRQCITDGHVITLRAKDINPFYLGYFVKSKQNTIELMAEGSTGQTEMNRQRLQNEIIVTFPESKDLQKRIAEYGLAIDKKIAVNNQLNDYLLELATVRFEQELVKESKTYRFSELIELEDSKRVPLNSRDRKVRKGSYPYYGATSIMDYVDDYLFDGIRVLLGEDGTVIREDGKPVLQYVWGKYWVNNHAHILKSKADYSLEAIYIALARTTINHIVTGAVQMKISQKNLNDLELEMPTASSLDYLEDIFALYRSKAEESKKLGILRDALLPKLMSGEIDVSKVDLTQLTNNHLWVHGHNVPNRYWKGHLWKPSLIMFCRRCRTCLIRHSSNIWPKYSESRYCQLRKHPCRRIC